MSEADRPKTAYELALERMEAGGIERPREEAYDSETLAAMDEVRSKADARLAEMDILHKRSLESIVDPIERKQTEDDHRAERQRIEDARDRDLERLRSR